MDTSTVVLEIQEHQTRVGLLGRSLPSLVADTQLASSFGQHDDGTYDFCVDVGIVGVDYKYWFQKLHPFLLRLMLKANLSPERNGVIVVCEDDWSIHFSVGLLLALKEMSFKWVYARKSSLLPLLSLPILDPTTNTIKCAVNILPGMTIIRFTPRCVYISISVQGHLLAETSCGGGDDVLCWLLRRCIIGTDVMTRVEQMLDGKIVLDEQPVQSQFTFEFMEEKVGGLLPWQLQTVENKDNLEQLPFLSDQEQQLHAQCAKLHMQLDYTDSGLGSLTQAILGLFFSSSQSNAEVFLICYAVVLQLSQFISTPCLHSIWSQMHYHFNSSSEPYACTVSDSFIPFPIACSITLTQYEEVISQFLSGAFESPHDTLSLAHVQLQLLQEVPTTLLPSVSPILVCGSATANSAYMKKQLQQQIKMCNSGIQRINESMYQCQVLSPVICPSLAVWTGAALINPQYTQPQHTTLQSLNIEDMPAIIKKAH